MKKFMKFLVVALVLVAAGAVAWHFCPCCKDKCECKCCEKTKALLAKLCPCKK